MFRVIIIIFLAWVTWDCLTSFHDAVNERLAQVEQHIEEIGQ